MSFKYAMHEEGAIRLAGKARDGRPVVMVQARYYWPKLVEDNIQIVYFFTFYVDGVCRMSETAGHETFYAIADLEGFSMSNFSLAQIKIAISILQNHYPERLGTIFVINAPFVFTAAWRLIQPLLDERTRSKIEILGSNYFDIVTEHIDPSQIEKPVSLHIARQAVLTDLIAKVGRNS
jgi:CRAL/TRIO domain